MNGLLMVKRCKRQAFRSSPIGFGFVSMIATNGKA